MTDFLTVLWALRWWATAAALAVAIVLAVEATAHARRLATQVRDLRAENARLRERARQRYEIPIRRPRPPVLRGPVIR